MPRLPRIDLPGVPQHVIQRGNDRRPCFFQELDYVRYLDELKELSIRSGCAIHAYVLMTNHVHLLLTPSQAGQVSALMQALGRRYVRYANDRYRRTGTLWEGRYKSCPVDNETYVLSCYRYIELNPVRAAMVAAPGDYRWSSFRSNAEGVHDALIRPHPSYLGLSLDDDSRRKVYHELVESSIPAEELELIRLRLQRQHALDSDRFREMIEGQLQRRAGPAKIGRPRKVRASNEDGLESAL